MTTRVILLLLGFLAPVLADAQITVEDCVSKAQDNYPLIKKYGLLDATADVDLSEINQSWLPRIGVYGQATVQNNVPSFPDALSGVLEQMGQSIKGLGKVQYKVGVDMSQTLWDGGLSAARREVARKQEAVKQRSLDVEMYAVRQRVESIYFAILLAEEYAAQSEVTRNLLDQNLERLRSMQRNGVAMQSDVDMLEAQLLTVTQGLTQTRSGIDGYRRVLGLFIGESLDGLELQKPSAGMPVTRESDRPELKLFDSRLDANSAAYRLSDTALMPKVGLFAQAYYGYPGLNYFQSMMNRDLSFNLLAGVKVSWNIDSFYSKRSNGRRKALAALDINADKELFLFNSNLQTASQTEAIEGLRDVMKDDARIVQLRENVRRTAEVQLDNGVIDITALLTKIADEDMAKLNARLHEIQLLKEIYNLKYTLNR